MTPPFYLTRAEDWVGGSLNPISEQEWWAFAESSNLLVCESRQVLMADQAGNEFFVIERLPVVPTGESIADSSSCLYWEHGNVATSENPSARAVSTLLAIAGYLSAKVQDSNFELLSSELDATSIKHTSGHQSDA